MNLSAYALPAGFQGAKSTFTIDKLALTATIYSKFSHDLRQPGQPIELLINGKQMLPVFDRLSEALRQHDVAFDVIRHEPVFTSEEAALVRGTSLASGAKALICKMDDSFVMFVLPADRKLASKAARGQLRARKMRFASREEVLALTGLTPGSIPPFGSLFHLPTYCDERLSSVPAINFNAGDHAISISMAYADYARVERPETGSFATG